VRFVSLAELRRLFGDRLIEDPVIVALYSRDASLEPRPAGAIGVVLPESEEEVVELVRWAVRNRAPLYPQGSATSLSGSAAATSPGVVVSFERMARMELRPEDGIAVVEPGVRLEELNAELARHGLFFPVDPGSAMSATVGGLVASGGGGMCGVRYGTVRDWVLGLRVVTGRGDVLKIGCRTLKCRSGYDLVRLFVGSEGTLGLITEAALRLAPLPESAAALLVYYDDVEALAGDVARVRAGRVWPLFAEYMDAEASALVGLERRHALFIGVESPAGAEGAALERLESLLRGEVARRAAGWAAAAGLLEPRRRLFAAQAARAREGGGVLVVEDVAVPPSRLAEAVRVLRALAERHGLPLIIGGHVGEGNLHPATWCGADGGQRLREFLRDVAALVAGLGGTVSAEHGVGALKRELVALELGERALAYMRELKRVFDPHGILNPGKVV
jgi:D-lactate dehydrogenase (cytochrome)/glycolate oxidase